MWCAQKIQWMLFLKNIYYSKRYIAINPPLGTLPIFDPHLSHRSCHFLKQFWKVPFLCVFSYAVLVASMSWISPAYLPFMVSFTGGRARCPSVSDTVSKADQDTLMFLRASLSIRWRQQQHYHIFLSHTSEFSYGINVCEVKGNILRRIGVFYSNKYF